MKGPLFSFYGAKWRTVPKYPVPGRSIVEPFAGSACYSSRYPDREVLLVERDPLLAALWRYLVRVSPEEIRQLPDLDRDSRADELQVCEEARWLIGFWMNTGGATPCHQFSAWFRKMSPRFSKKTLPEWWAARRERIAQDVAEIKHWRIFEGEWHEAPLLSDATYFVDPPYQRAGNRYRFAEVDYPKLAHYCQALHTSGNQVIVCENMGADWLPFRHLADVRASNKKSGARYSAEVVWP